ncbi:MAG: hypothetical protein AB8H12_06980 [Lewinella sp.]
MTSSLFLSLWKANSLSVDLTQWRAMVLEEEFWLELMPFVYFVTLLLAGGSLVWPHKYSLLLLFSYAGFTLEELILSYLSSTAVPFSYLSHWWLFSTVVGGIGGLFLLKKEQNSTGDKYRFRALWFGIAFGLSCSLLLSILGF